MSSSTKTTAKHRRRLRSAFGAEVVAHLERLHMSLSAFAKAVNTPVSTLDFYLGEGVKPPLKRLERWSTVLQLAGDDKIHFYQVALAPHLGRDGAQFVFQARR